MTKIIFLSTKNCSTCKKLKGAMDYANIEGYEYRCIDPAVKEDMDFIKKYNTFSFPVLLKLDENGKEIGKLHGLQPLSAIKNFIGE